ncbi:CPCC family cysteine-rich protein [Ralstonia solanacearum]|uniref:CPCC family cysteine-rich protein n=1 Tax=Ralstonia solanacearum TaxID=305 RepID=UPI003AF31B65
MSSLSVSAPAMNSSSSVLFTCPCCGEKTLCELGVYEICPICLWEDDPTQSAEPEHAGGANGRSLIEARRQWLIQKQTR